MTMNKQEQLVKELQALIDKPEMNEIIEQKMSDAWFEGSRECTREWVRRQEVFARRQKEGLSEEERKRMDKTHIWQDGEYETECIKCGIGDNTMFECPQYCLTKEEKEA